MNSFPQGAGGALDVISQNTGDAVRKVHGRDLAAGVVTALFRLVKLATLHSLDNQAIARQVEDTVQVVGEYGARTGHNVSVLFAQQSVFVGGQLLRAPRGVYEGAVELGEILGRVGASEIGVMKDAKGPDFYAFASAIADALRQSKPPKIERPSQRIRLRPMAQSALGREMLNIERLDPMAQVTRTYASAIVIMRRFFEQMRKGKYELPQRVKRVAQKLVDLSAGETPAFLGVTAARNQNHDDAGRAVNTAILSLAMARQISDDPVMLVRLAMAALLYDCARPRLAGAVGEHAPILIPQLSEQQENESAAGTAAVITALSRVNEPGVMRTVMTYEAHWEKRRGRLGPVYRGLRPPSLQARLIYLARAFNDRLTPAPGETPPAADEVIARIEAEATDAADRTVLRLLIGALGIFPTGTLVELSTAEVGIVARTHAHPSKYSRPIIRLVFDARGGQLPRPVEIDLAVAPKQGEPARVIRRIVATSDDPSAAALRSLATAQLAPQQAAFAPQAPQAPQTQQPQYQQTPQPPQYQQQPQQPQYQQPQYQQAPQQPQYQTPQPPQYQPPQQQPQQPQYAQPQYQQPPQPQFAQGPSQRADSAFAGPYSSPVPPAAQQQQQDYYAQQRAAQAPQPIALAPSPQEQAFELEDDGERAGGATRAVSWEEHAQLLVQDEALSQQHPPAHETFGRPPEDLTEPEAERLPELEPAPPPPPDDCIEVDETGTPLHVAPTAEGSFTRTPLVHLLVYMLDNKLTGSTLLVTPEGERHVIYFYEGAAAKLKTGAMVAPLDRVILDQGLLEEEVIRGTLMEMVKKKVLHGRLLVQKGLLERETVISTLRLQLLKKMTYLFELPPETTYAYYDGINLLEGFAGPELVPYEPLAVIMSGVRLRANDALVDATLEKISQRQLSLHVESQGRRFEFHRDEAAVVDLLRTRKMMLAEILDAGVGKQERVVRMTLYALAITRHLDLGNGRPPVGLFAAGEEAPNKATVVIQPDSPPVRVRVPPKPEPKPEPKSERTSLPPRQPTVTASKLGPRQDTSPSKVAAREQAGLGPRKDTGLGPRQDTSPSKVAARQAAEAAARGIPTGSQPGSSKLGPRQDTGTSKVGRQPSRFDTTPSKIALRDAAAPKLGPRQNTGSGSLGARRTTGEQNAGPESARGKTGFGMNFGAPKKDASAPGIPRQQQDAPQMKPTTKMGRVTPEPSPAPPPASQRPRAAGVSAPPSSPKLGARNLSLTNTAPRVANYYRPTPEADHFPRPSFSPDPIPMRPMMRASMPPLAMPVQQPQQQQPIAMPMQQQPQQQRPIAMPMQQPQQQRPIAMPMPMQQPAAMPQQPQQQQPIAMPMPMQQPAPMRQQPIAAQEQPRPQPPAQAASQAGSMSGADSFSGQPAKPRPPLKPAQQATPAPPVATPPPAPSRQSMPAPAASNAPKPGDPKRRAEIEARADLVEKDDYFKLLGLERTAEAGDIQKAYFAFAKTWHPDRLPGDLQDLKPQVAKVFARITEAYQTLNDPAKRATYVASLDIGGGAAADEAEEIARVVDAALEFQKAEVLLKKNDLQGAEQLAKRAAMADPEQPDYVTLLTWIQAERRGMPQPVREGQTSTHYDDLIRTLDGILTKEPQYEKALYYRGMLLKRAGKLDRSIRDFRLVAQLNPKNIDAVREVRLFEMRKRAGKKDGGGEGGGLFGKFFKR